MRILYVTGLALLQQTVFAQTDTLSNQQQLQEVVVSGVHATNKQPVTFSKLDKADIQKQNYGQDLPFLLNLTPSTVVSSDAGAGIGYTGIRIRGTDPSRTNVTINGIQINDAESHGMFWVNMPDFASSAQSIQVQRGVGTSSNGAGAFGASINVQTDVLQTNPYGEASVSFGSFNTRRYTVKAGTGLLSNGWSFDLRLSDIQSDGFIDRSSSDLKSYFASAKYVTSKSMLTLIAFSGKEKTYQAWNGIPEARLKGDVAGMNQLASDLWMSQTDLDHMLASGNRTYNSFTYANQTDNYQSDNYQMFFSRLLGKHTKANIGLHYTYGRGYYEEYRTGESFNTYKLPDSIVVDGVTHQSGDFIRRRWLDNDFYGTVFSIAHEHNKLSITFGGALNTYIGRHYGELIWAQYSLGSTINQHFYDGHSNKDDYSAYLKAGYQFTNKLEAFVDVQGRLINYTLKGEDLSGSTYRPYDFDLQYHFFNPKAGLTYQLSENNNVYAYVGVANKEPIRNDIIQASASSLPKPERLINYEMGWRKSWKKSAITLNGFYMDYRDQLVATGALNDVGAYNRVNVGKSYRTGIELTGGLQVIKPLRWQATATYSQNRIQQFTEYLDDWDTYTQIAINHKNTAIAYSPDWIASSLLTYTPIKGFSLDWISKYVGEQFMDNTGNSNRKLDAFWVNDIRISYTTSILHFCKSVRLGLQVNNILNTEYEPNGYTFSGQLSGQRKDFNYYYPQAGTNFLANITLLF